MATLGCGLTRLATCVEGEKMTRLATCVEGEKMTRLATSVGTRLGDIWEDKIGYFAAVGCFV